MALFKNEPTSYLIKLDDMLLKQKGLQRSLVQSLVDRRWEAKKNKDYKASDEIRDELIKIGIEVRDSAQGSDWEVKK
jgi:cysteinyl-tRNA synthetase